MLIYPNILNSSAENTRHKRESGLFMMAIVTASVSMLILRLLGAL